MGRTAIFSIVAVDDKFTTLIMDLEQATRNDSVLFVGECDRRIYEYVYLSLKADYTRG